MLADTAPLYGVTQPSSLLAAPHQGKGGGHSDHQLLPGPPPRSSIPPSHASLQPGISACLALPGPSLIHSKACSPAVDAASGSRVDLASCTGLDTAFEALHGLPMSVTIIQGCLPS